MRRAAPAVCSDATGGPVTGSADVRACHVGWNYYWRTRPRVIECGPAVVFMRSRSSAGQLGEGLDDVRGGMPQRGHST